MISVSQKAMDCGIQWCQKEIKADKCNDDDTNQTVYNSMRLGRSVGLVTLLRIVFLMFISFKYSFTLLNTIIADNK